MSIKKDIQTKGFITEQEKTYVNLFHTAAFFESKFNQFIKDFGISPQQYNVLRILRGQSPNSILYGDLQERMIHKMSNATRLVDKLEEKDLVVRIKSKEDKRQMLVSINQNGLSLLSKLDTHVAEFNLKFMNLPEAQLMVLNLLLDDLKAASK